MTNELLSKFTLSESNDRAREDDLTEIGRKKGQRKLKCERAMTTVPEIKKVAGTEMEVGRGKLEQDQLTSDICLSLFLRFDLFVRSSILFPWNSQRASARPPLDYVDDIDATMEAGITILTAFVLVCRSVDDLTSFLAMAYREISPRPGINAS
jgi:hypothetical protein